MFSSSSRRRHRHAYLNILYKNLDLTMFLNGILGGLVGITAGADQMSPGDAILIGAVAGALIVFAVSLVDKIKLDDPVGAIAVHLVCGIWGTLAVGLFGAKAGFDQFLSTTRWGVVLRSVLCCHHIWYHLHFEENSRYKSIGTRRTRGS